MSSVAKADSVNGQARAAVVAFAVEVCLDNDILVIVMEQAAKWKI